VRLRFTVPGPPVPKARARVVTTKSGRARSYTPGPTVAYQQVVGRKALTARQNVSGWPWGMAGKHAPRFGLDVIVYRSAKRGDWDNFGKAISDACNGILWADDRQIVDGRVRIEECAKGKERVEVEVWTLD
jgi:crossover junction endodeoxyribonuclease RusA